MKEQCSWSGKKKINSIKCLSVVDYTGRFTICQVSFGNNDREAYTSSLLYLEEGLYFSGDQFVATDSASESDAGFCAPTKTLVMIPTKLRSIMHSERFELERKIVISALVLGFHG